MSGAPWSEGFLESTRGRVLTLLRGAPATVEELAQTLELTDNAVRAHLSALERDGLIRSRGARRDGSVGKPATLYSISSAAETAFSRAYVPLLSTLLTALGEKLPIRELKALMRDVGKRLAGVPLPATATARVRAEAASGILNSLGGLTTVKRDGKDYRVEGVTCPLSVAVSARPEVCEAVRTLLSESTGSEVIECCRRGERNQCTFVVGGAQ